jgi:hypothetical protein
LPGESAGSGNPEGGDLTVVRGSDRRGAQKRLPQVY